MMNRRNEIRGRLRHYTILELMEKQNSWAPVKDQAQLAAKLGMLKPIYPLKPVHNTVYEEKRVWNTSLSAPLCRRVLVLMIIVAMDDDDIGGSFCTCATC